MFFFLVCFFFNFVVNQSHTQELTARHFQYCFVFMLAPVLFHVCHIPDINNINSNHLQNNNTYRSYCIIIIITMKHSSYIRLIDINLVFIVCKHFPFNKTPNNFSFFYLFRYTFGQQQNCDNKSRSFFMHTNQ